MKQLPLPILDRIIFIDWQGVLSRDPFWASIVSSSTHPLRPQLAPKLAEVFSNKSTIHHWMKGVISSQDVISQMAILPDRRFGQDFLARRLVIDCLRMQVNMEIAEMLRVLKPHAFIVLATDNMDCFAWAFERAQASRRRLMPGSNSLLFAGWASMFDALVCSSDVGTLKAEDPVGFFGPLLSEFGLEFPQALLIDDRSDNCEAFRQLGGAAIQWEADANDIRDLTDSVQGWIGSLTISNILATGNDNHAK